MDAVAQRATTEVSDSGRILSEARGDAEGGEEGKPMSMTTISEFLKNYGPYSFGIASLLILWIAILKPEIERNRLDFDQMRAVIEEQSQQVKLMQMSATTLHDTATLLDSTVKRLESVRNAH